MTTHQRLTDRQREIYDVIRAFIVTHGYAPVVRELMALTGIGSTNGMVCHLKALEKKGWLTRTGFTARAIILTGPDQTPLARPDYSHDDRGLVVAVLAAFGLTNSDEETLARAAGLVSAEFSRRLSAVASGEVSSAPPALLPVDVAADVSYNLC